MALRSRSRTRGCTLGSASYAVVLTKCAAPSPSPAEGAGREARQCTCATCQRLAQGAERKAKGGRSAPQSDSRDGDRARLRSGRVAAAFVLCISTTPARTSPFNGLELRHARVDLMLPRGASRIGGHRSAAALPPPQRDGRAPVTASHTAPRDASWHLASASASTARTSCVGTRARAERRHASARVAPCTGPAEWGHSTNVAALGHGH